MRAMILAAGIGRRLHPLTKACPKPLVPVAGKPLIVYHIENLKKAGVVEIIINLYYLGEQIEAYLGDGATWGVSITYVRETTLLEVGGGVCNALPLLGDAPFIIVNADIWTEYAFVELPALQGMAHIVLVDNPPHHPKGDYFLYQNGQVGLENGGKRILAASNNRNTYAGIALLSPALFSGCKRGVAFPLTRLFERAIQEEALYGELYEGKWIDVGTLDRLHGLEKMLCTL